MQTGRPSPAIAVALLVVLAGCGGLAPPTASDADGTATMTPEEQTPAPETATRTTPARTQSTGPSTPTDVPYSDADGDGFTACEERRLLEGASPERMDVYVEVDWTAGARPDPEALQELVAVYDDAPVDNPGREDGVDLHLVYDEELPAREEPLSVLNLTHYADEFDNAGRGYHHAVFVERVQGSALGRGVKGTILVQQAYEEFDRTTYVNVFAHELGHSLGLTTDVFRGVDSFRMPYERYPSVMSQTGVFETIRFSNGTNHEGDFDDWGYLEEELYTPNTSRLENESSMC